MVWPDLSPVTFKSPSDILARSGIQISGRLICKNDGGLCNKRPGNCDLCCCPARKLVGQVIKFFLDPKRIDKLFYVTLIPPYCRPVLWGGTIFFIYIQHRYQIIALEHKPYFSSSENGQLLILQAEDILAIHEYLYRKWDDPVRPAYEGALISRFRRVPTIETNSPSSTEREFAPFKACTSFSLEP